MVQSSVLSEQSRMTWMDAVRGTAILLLLLWHASAVPVLYDVSMPEAIRAANAFFLPFRMPTLMLLSGMLLARSLRKPLPRYLAGKVAMVLWPYLVWVLIAELTFLEQPGLPWWHWRAWYATSYLWFLFFIGVYYAIAPLLRRLPAWAPIVAAAGAGLVLEPGSMEQRMAYFAVFFFAGNLLSRSPQLVDRLSRPRTTTVLAVPAVAFGAASVVRPELLHHLVWGAPLSLLGSLVLIGLFSRARSGGRLLAGVEFLGRSSIVFYVSHFPVMALLSQSPVAGAGALPLAAANLAAALLVGTVLARTRSIVPVRWLFEAPGAFTAALTALLGGMLRSRPAPPPATSQLSPRGSGRAAVADQSESSS